MTVYTPYIYGLLKPIYGHTVTEPVAQCHIRYRIYGVPRIRRIYGHTVWANPIYVCVYVCACVCVCARNACVCWNSACTGVFINSSLWLQHLERFPRRVDTLTQPCCRECACLCVCDCMRTCVRICLCMCVCVCVHSTPCREQVNTKVMKL
jgi:hypothetical protein